MPEHPRRPQRPSPPASSRPPRSTSNKSSWEKSAGWYDGIIGDRGSPLYQAVVLPKAISLLKPKPGEVALDLGCGQGVFSRVLAKAGCKVTGLDLSPTLIEKARSYPAVEPPIRFLHRDASKLSHLGTFDLATAILSLQNMPHLPEVCASVAASLNPGGRMLWVMNHPCFRIPKGTSWGWDEENGIQFRRVDGYSQPAKIPITMHPGQARSETTLSFHLSLETLMKAAFDAGFLLGGFEEWHSDRKSEPGPKARAENRAREEFPLFLGMLWRKA